MPIVTGLLALYEWHRLESGSEYARFFGALGFFVMSYLGIGGALGFFVMSYLGIAISLWPMIVPGHFTLDEAAASQSTQAFLLVGTLFLLPTVLVYTAWSYWVFRGKVSLETGYH